MAASLRVDVLLHRLCLTRSRSEAKAACDADAVSVDGTPARASQPVSVGQVVAVRYPQRTIEARVLALPGKSVSKQAARKLYEVLRDGAGAARG